jgi:predicted acetyltransferase
MCLDANWQSPDESAGAQVDLASMPHVTAGDFRYAPRYAFRATTGVPGVVYEMLREADGECIGEVSLLLSDDEAAVMHVGHMGCAIRPEHRKQGHTTRLMHALAPVLRERGVRDLIIGADVGHASLYQSILDAGATLVGEDFGDGSGQCGARFRLSGALPAAE